MTIQNYGGIVKDPTILGLINGTPFGIVNVLDYGVKPNVISSQSSKINLILNKYQGNTIYFPAGRYYINQTLIIFSDTKMILSKNAEIYLMDNVNTNTQGSSGSNAIHMIKNDLANGLSNITIRGGTWNGNGANQAWDSYYGMKLCEIDGLEVGELRVESTNGWGIAHFECTNYHFHDIELDQDLATEASPYNGDGIIGTSSNGLIENIYGYTNDDLIALNAGNTLYVNKSDIENVIITNIRPQRKGGVGASHGLGLYATGNHIITNITVDNVVGYVRDSGVYLSAFNDGSGNFGSIGVINFNNITLERDTNAQAYFVFLNFRMIDTININNVTILDSLVASNDIINITNSYINNINLNSIRARYTVATSSNNLITDNGSVGTINFNNVIFTYDTPLSTDPLPSLYYKPSTMSGVTLLQGSNILTSWDRFTKGSVLTNPSQYGKIRINSLEITASILDIDKTKLKKGDKVFIIGFGATEFDGANLVPMHTLVIPRASINALFKFNGLLIYDSRLNKLLTWDGTNWRDMAGAIVV